MHECGFYLYCFAISLTLEPHDVTVLTAFKLICSHPADSTLVWWLFLFLSLMVLFLFLIETCITTIANIDESNKIISNRFPNFFQSQILTSLPFSPITIEKHSNELRHPTLYHRPLVVSCLDLQKGIACYWAKYWCGKSSFRHLSLHSKWPTIAKITDI